MSIKYEANTGSHKASPLALVGYAAMLIGLGLVSADAFLAPESMGAFTPAGLLALFAGYPLSNVK